MKTLLQEDIGVTERRQFTHSLPKIGAEFVIETPAASGEAGAGAERRKREEVTTTTMITAAAAAVMSLV